MVKSVHGEVANGARHTTRTVSPRVRPESGSLGSGTAQEAPVNSLTARAWVM